MRKLIAKLEIYVIDNGSKRRLYRTQRNTKKETPYFYIKNNKAVYLTAEEGKIVDNSNWLAAIPIRNN